MCIDYAHSFIIVGMNLNTNNFNERDITMASKSNNQPTDLDENPTKKIKTFGMDERNLSVDVSLEIVFGGFQAPPVCIEERELKHLPEFLVKHGSQVTKLNYAEDAGENNRQLIIKHCHNISEVTFEFTEYPDQVDDAESQRLVKFLTALAPGLTRLETINNLVGLHYLSCMGYIYESFSKNIKFVKTDELKEEELSVLSGDNNKNNPALSLEELIYCDNIFLYCKKRNSQSAESLALKPASLTDLVKLTNLRRIDLPFFLSKDKIPPVTAPLPLLNYASIRLLSNKRGKVAASTFTENIGIALANTIELKLDGVDPGALVLMSILTNGLKLEKLDLTHYSVRDVNDVEMAKLPAVKPKLKQLDARTHYRSQEIDVILCLINRASSLATINIVGINDEEYIDRLIAAGVALSEKVQHNVELNLRHCLRKDDKFQVPTAPGNLKIAVHYSDSY